MILIKFLSLLERNYFFELLINFQHGFQNGFPLLFCLTHHFLLINTKVNFNIRKLQTMVIYTQAYYFVLFHFTFLCFADLAFFTIRRFVPTRPRAIYQHHFPNSICSLCDFVSHLRILAIFQTFS